MPAALPAHAGLEVGALLGDVVEAEAVEAGLHLLLSLLLCWLGWLGWLLGGSMPRKQENTTALQMLSYK